MKRTTGLIVTFACLVVVLLIATAFAAASSANAQLGNTGVPARCRGGANVQGSGALTCTAADGTAFGNNQTVPTGYYLHVTDVQIEPTGAATGFWSVALYQKQGTTSINATDFATYNGNYYGEHYTSPLFVLRGGQHLELDNFGTTGMVLVEVEGLLTTNVTYAPLITR